MSQGLFLSARRWAEAAVSFFGPADQYLAWSGLPGFFAWGTLQAVCVLLGSILAGAGQRDWIFYGLALGFINTVIDLALSGNRFFEISPIMILLLMIASFLAGVVGCRIGAWIWRPLDTAKTTLELGMGGKAPGGIAVRDLFAGLNFLTLRVNWLRIVIGAVLGILGAAFASELFYRTVNAIGLRGALEQALDVKTNIFIIMVRTMSVFVAGFIAGSNSTNGLAHGFWAGGMVALGLAVERYLRGLTNPEAFVPQEVLAFSFIYLALCLLGGYFGSKLLPPVIHTGKRKLTKVAEI